MTPMTMSDLVVGVPMLFLMMCSFAAIPHLLRAIRREFRAREAASLQQYRTLHMRGPVRRG